MIYILVSDYKTHLVKGLAISLKIAVDDVSPCTVWLQLYKL